MIKKLIKLLILFVLLLPCCERIYSEDEYAKQIRDKTTSYEEVCIGGHVYYRGGSGHSIHISPKFKDSGLPVRCWIKGKK